MTDPVPIRIRKEATDNWDDAVAAAARFQPRLDP